MGRNNEGIPWEGTVSSYLEVDAHSMNTISASQKHKSSLEEQHTTTTHSLDISLQLAPLSHHIQNFRAGPKSVVLKKCVILQILGNTSLSQIY